MDRVWKPLLCALVALTATSNVASRVSFYPSIFVNATDFELVIRYEMFRTTKNAGGFEPCENVRVPPRARPEIVSSRNWDEGEWLAAENVQIDRETCVTEITVKPRTSLWVHNNGLCNDYEEYLQRNPAVHPAFRSFQITAGKRPVVLQGWDVAKAFKKRGDACIYKFTQ
jgi:hypothetical protein